MNKLNNIMKNILPIFKYKFILYKNMTTPINEKISYHVIGFYRHSFGCSFKHALTQWGCIKQIAKFERFYHSVSRDKNDTRLATKFPIVLFPIVYLYSIIDMGMFHKVSIIK